MSDGTSDEAPRFPKPLQTGIALFKELKLDVLLHGVNASGLSALNPVERWVAPPSHDLVKIILQHDSYGNHLDEHLPNIWSRTVIDGHPIDRQARQQGQEFVPPTSYAKCYNETCCEPFQTDWLGAFPDRFIPFPPVYEYKSNG